MTITYRIDTRLNIVFTIATDVLTDNDLLEHKQKLTHDSKFKPGMFELSDIRSITKLDVTSDGIRRFVRQDELDASRLSDYKLALVVSKDIAYGMARMYEMLTGSHLSNVSVFRDIDDAKKWLGCSSEKE